MRMRKYMRVRVYTAPFFGFMAVKAGEVVLTEYDVVDILEELLPAQNSSHELGLKLGLSPERVQGIHDRYSDPRQRLRQVIIEYVNETERPTWSSIVAALKSRLVDLPRLASRVEAAHSPDDTATASDTTQEVLCESGKC